MVVVNRDQQFLDDVLSLKTYILGELNVKEVTVSQDKAKYGVVLKAEPNFKLLGKRLKGDQKKVADYLKVGGFCECNAVHRTKSARPSWRS